MHRFVNPAEALPNDFTNVIRCRDLIEFFGFMFVPSGSAAQMVAHCEQNVMNGL